MFHSYLELTDHDRAQLVEVGKRLEPHVDQLVAEVAAVLGDAEEVAGILPSGPLEDALRPGLVRYLTALSNGGIEEHLRTSVAEIRQRAEEGVPYEALVAAIMAFQQAAGGVIRQAFPDEAQQIGVRDAFLKLNHRHLALAANAYLAGKEGTIRAQQAAMLALSTPVVEVWQGVLALPLVGTIDTGRAKQITQNLLHTIRDTQARIVIVDITGVPLVDTRVANHLMKTIRAASLLGARGILVGISPEIADTLIGLDVTLDGVETYFSLRQGLEAALGALGLDVVPRRITA